LRCITINFYRDYSSNLQFLIAVVIGVLLGTSIIVPITVVLSKNQSSAATLAETTTVTTLIGTTMPATTTTTTTTTTTRLLNYTTITRPSDTIVGIFNTIVGSSSNWMMGNFPTSENPLKAIDNNVNTKYLNYGDNLGGGSVFGINSGYSTC
jgi:hypothetical protein